MPVICDASHPGLSSSTSPDQWVIVASLKWVIVASLTWSRCRNVENVQCHVQTSVTITETDTWWNAAGCLQIGIIWYLYLYWYIAMICNVCTCIRQCTKIYDQECMTWRICEGLSEVLGALSSGSDGFLDKNKDQLSNAATSDHARFMRGWKLHLIPDFERHHTVLIILALHWAACSGRNIKNSTCFTKLIQL